MTPRRRVLIVQPSVQPPGGGNSVAAWMIQALRDDHEVGLCTFAPFDAAAVNRFYGTSLRPDDVVPVPAPRVGIRVIDAAPLPLAMLRHALLMRHARRVGRDWEVLVSGHNEMDFGRPGIEYIHYPWRARPRPGADLRWYHLRPLLAAYYRLCDALAGPPAGQAPNLTLVNSDWTGAQVRRLYGLPTRTLYPPVVADFPEVPWERRATGFVCLGRIAPEKGLPQVIAIVGAVRREIPDVRLHIVGTRGRRRDTRAILRRARAAGAWVSVHLDLPRPDLARLVASQRYGIHGMLEEHFGIAVAEMLVAGCVVFVPAGGGQVEIVGGDDRFLYRTPQEAVAKIVATITDPAGPPRAGLAALRSRYSTERFVREFRDIVAAFPAAAPAPGGPRAA